MGSKKRKAAAAGAAQQQQAVAADGDAATPPRKRAAHDHTGATPSGVGQQLAAVPGRLAREPLPSLSSSQPAAKWAPPAAALSCCPATPRAAVELELARAAALDSLRHRLASLAAKAGLRNVPLLAFERWRFAAKWAEDEPQLAAAAAAGAQQQADKQASKQAKQRQQACDPVVPFGSLTAAPEPGLVSDLVRAGLAAAAAVGVAEGLAAAAASAAAALVRKRQQLASGKAPSCGPVSAAVHKHSIDFSCADQFVKVSRPAYGKLARLYREHYMSRASSSSSGGGSTAAAAAADEAVGLPAAEAAARVAALEASSGQAAGGDGDSSGGDDESEGEAAGDAGAAQQQRGSSTAAAAAAGKAGGRVDRALLDAEARLAELQTAQPEDVTAAAAADSSSTGRAAFHSRLFALLLRYKSIQGHGFQAAAGPGVFDLLRQRLAVGFECFGSPLNAHFSRFGSAFPDVDTPFGSTGSFFRSKLKHGSYEVNPPFVPALLTAAAQHMLALLADAEAAGGALSFVVLMPGWQEVPGWQALQGSSFLRQSLLVAAADHGYADGASHQRRDLYRASPFDTSVLFLQTSAAAAKWPVRAPLLEALRLALASCVPTAAAAERQKKKRGRADLALRGAAVAGGGG